MSSDVIQDVHEDHVLADHLDVVRIGTGASMGSQLLLVSGSGLCCGSYVSPIGQAGL